MSTITNKKALQAQFQADKADGTTLATKYGEWLKEQTEERLALIQASTTIESVAGLVTDIQTQVAHVQQVVHEAKQGVSKAQLAKAIFDEVRASEGGLVRKTCIERFMSEAGLTKAGANTYYQNLREKYELVTHKS